MLLLFWLVGLAEGSPQPPRTSGGMCNMRSCLCVVSGACVRRGCRRQRGGWTVTKGGYLARTPGGPQAQAGPGSTGRGHAGIQRQPAVIPGHLPQPLPLPVLLFGSSPYGRSSRSGRPKAQRFVENGLLFSSVGRCGPRTPPVSPPPRRSLSLRGSKGLQGGFRCVSTCSPQALRGSPWQWGGRARWPWPCERARRR